MSVTAFRPVSSAPVSSPSHLPDLLRLTPLFENLEDRLIERLAAITQEARLPEDTEVCGQGDPALHLHVLLEGRVALWASAPDESRAAVEVVRPPGYFVLATVLTRLPHLMSARTVSAAHLLLIDTEGLHALLASEVELANALLHAEALNFRALVRQVQDLKLRTAAQRLACYLLALSNETEATTASSACPSTSACWRRGSAAGRRTCRAPLPRCAAPAWRRMAPGWSSTTSPRCGRSRCRTRA